MEDRRQESFRRLLQRISESEPKPIITKQDREKVSRFPEYDNSKRRQIPVPMESDEPKSVEQFVLKGNILSSGSRHRLPQYDVMREGVHDCGWQCWPFSAKLLGKGAFGSVQLLSTLR